MKNNKEIDKKTNMEEFKAKGNYQKITTEDNDWIYIHKVNKKVYFIDVLSDNTELIIITGGTRKKPIKIEVR